MYAVRRLSLITKFHHLDVEAGEWQGRTRAVDAHGPIGEARVTATWNVLSPGVVGGRKEACGSGGMFHDPQTIQIALIGLGVLCV